MMDWSQTGTPRELGAGAAVGDPGTRLRGLSPGRGIVIAHPSPSVRVKLAMGLIDDHPVFMANGPKGLLRQMHAVHDGVVRAPQALVLGERELRSLRSSRLWEALSTVPMTIVLVAATRRRVNGVHVVYSRPPRAEEVRQLLAA